MAEGTRHIERSDNRAWCGAPMRKSIMDRRQECPQCMRVRKRNGGGK